MYENQCKMNPIGSLKIKSFLMQPSLKKEVGESRYRWDY